MIFYVIKNGNELFKLKKITKDKGSEYEFYTKLSESEMLKIIGNSEYLELKNKYSKNDELINKNVEFVFMNKKRIESVLKERENNVLSIHKVGS
jgi:hypothetical protein